MIKKADILWQGDTPVSKGFNEGYFSLSGGLEESLHVFLKGNDLTRAWEDKDIFVIGESGFGTGLNFLNVLKLYENSIKKPKELWFVSVEKEPLSLQDIKKAHSFFSDILPYSKLLQAKYPPLSSGLHLLSFKNVKLMLYFGDIKEAFSSLEFKANAWFLDGFSPSKNPDMWDEKTLNLIKNRSAKNATLSTFSVARVLRDGLDKAGFVWKKTDGFGDKKQMLKAHLPISNESSSKKPWFANIKPYDGEKRAIVVGSGIAGASIVYKLASKGWEVNVLEKAMSPGQGGSGNHCGAVTPLITLPDIALGQMYERAFLQAVSFYKELGIGKFEGLKHYAHNASWLKRWEAWSCRGSEIFECKEDEIGKYFHIHSGGYLQPFKACAELINASENIKFYPDSEVVDFVYKNEMYELKTHKKSFKAPVLIISNAYEAENLLKKHSLSLQKIRGQVSFLPKAVQTKEPLCAKGYVCPFIDGKQVIGATYIKDDECKSVRVRDNQENLDNVKEFLGGLKYDAKSLDGRVSYRCSSGDRFPIVGALGDVDFFKSEYKAMPWKRHKPHLFKEARYLPNLYISTAHGSRGLVSSILGANIIASMLDGAPIPLDKHLLDELNPNRFIIRRLQRQEVW